MKVGDKIKLYTASDNYEGVCTVTKIRNFKKDRRIYFKSEYGYGLMAWEKNLNYEPCPAATE